MYVSYITGMLIYHLEKNATNSPDMSSYC